VALKFANFEVPVIVSCALNRVLNVIRLCFDAILLCCPDVYGQNQTIKE